MSTDIAFMTSKSTLMHAALAHLSQEIQTIDDILHNPPAPSTSRNFLPTEIFILIREYLFPTVIARLVNQSTVALEAYEQSLVELLCPDCIAYNLDIYGPDIWQWVQFSGACACAPADAQDPHAHRTTGAGGIRHYHSHNSKTAPGNSNLNPRKFSDPEHWLESHLSGVAASALPFFEYRGHSQLASSVTRPLGDIWDVVAVVLRELNCEAIREPEDKSHIHSGVGRGQSPTKYTFVRIVPLRHYVDPSLDPTSTSSSPLPTREEIDWRAHVILHRASRDLGLSLELTEAFSTRERNVHLFTRRLRWPGVSNPCYKRQDIIDFADTLLRILTSLTAACLSSPITFATVALTILCFYSRPHSLRIL